MSHRDSPSLKGGGPFKKDVVEDVKKDVIKVKATRMGFLGKGEGSHRVRPDKILNVSRSFFEENSHWLVEEKDIQVAEDKVDNRPTKMDVL